MKKALLSGVTLLLYVGTANAADLPAKAPVYKAAPVATPYSWRGFYVGLQGGYAWGSQAISLSPDATFAGFFAAGTIPASIAAKPRGGLVGIEYGTNWQSDRIVYGTASDLSFGEIKRSETIVTTATNVGEQKLSWFGTTRVRAGYLVQDNLLLYGSGGLASGRAAASSSSTLIAGCAGVGACSAGSDSRTLWGWAAGGGVEYVMGHWSAKLEYLHYDLGRLNYNMTSATAPGAAIGVSTRFAGDIVRAGLDYRFDWTPWELIFGK